MDNLYTCIEDGIADEYDLERLKKGKEEMTTVKTKLLELESKAEITLQPEQILPVIGSYRTILKNKKSTEDLRASLNTFINKITIHSTEIAIQFKINFGNIVGARGGT